MAKKAPAKKGSEKECSSPALEESILTRMYRNVYATRQFELRCMDLYRQGLIRGYLHPYLGEEAIAAGACAAITQEDYILSTHRGHGHCISKGADLKLMTAEIMGRATGYCKGNGFLADVHMCRAAHHVLHEQVTRLLLKLADQDHLPVHFEM